MRRFTSIPNILAIVLTMISIGFARGDRNVKVMDHSFYEEILFPGYEKLNAVWDLHVSGPYVYVALCAEAPFGGSAALFRYDTRTGEKKMILNPDRVAGVDLETGVLPQSKFHTAIRTMKDGRLFMVSHNTAAGLYQPYWVLYSLWHDPTGFSSRAFIYDPVKDLAIYKGVPIPNEDIYYGQIDRDWNLYYACGIRTGSLYVIDLNDMSVTEIANHPCNIAIVVDDDHMVYTTDHKERIWKWDPIRKKSTMKGLRMPHSPFLTESVGSCTYAWKDPDGWIYAVAQYCNRICRFKPNEGIMQDLGNGWREDPEQPRGEMIFAPVKANNGKIYYGVLNENRPLFDGAEVIELDPETGKKRNLGTMRLSDGTNANVFGEGGLGADGRIYWGDGNHDRRGGMMWAFDPSRVPDDYVPTQQVQRVSRVVPTPEMRKVEIGKSLLWRLRPEVRVFKRFEPLKDKELSEEKVEKVSLMDAGYPLWNNGVYSLSEPSNGYIYGIAGGQHYSLFRLSEKKLKIEKLAEIPVSKEIQNGNGVVAGNQGVFVIGENLYRWSGSGLQIFRKFDKILPAALALDRKKNRLYVLTEPDNQLLVLDASDGSELKRFYLIGSVQSRWLVPLKNGGVVGFEGNAGVYKIDEGLNLKRFRRRFASFKGLEFIAEVTSATVGADGKVWGGTREGYLFSIDPAKGLVANWGKPGPYYLKGVVASKKAVYAMSGGNFGDTHLFRFRRDAGFEDLGVLTKKLVHCAVHGGDGNIYVGEYSSSSNVLRFAPD